MNAILCELADDAEDKINETEITIIVKSLFSMDRS